MQRCKLTGSAIAVAMVAAALIGAAPATAGGGAAAGIFHRPIAVIAANQSGNWSGYNQGVLEDDHETYKSVAGTWTVPTATQHVRGQAEYSSVWTGIGGGCIDTACTATDNTLIQAGTEQDVSASGHATYSAWWEIIPEPSTPVSLAVAPGNRVSVTITEGTPGLWTIVIRNLSTGRSVTVTTPYTSSHATAEWIVETPLIIGTGGGFAALPNLSTVGFDRSLTDGVTPALATAEQIQLTNGSGQVIAAPSNPDVDRDGFNDCAWHSSCAAPSSS